MTRERWRRVVPWALLAAILAVGVTAVVEAGAFDDGGGSSAVSQVGPSASANPSPSATMSAASPAPTSKPSPVTRHTVASTPQAAHAAPSQLPKLSDTHPDYPPTQTLVDKKDGLVVAVYTVQRGDYLSEIAGRFQTPLTDVYVWSKDTVGPNANLIYSGQQIVVKVLEKI